MQFVTSKLTAGRNVGKIFQILLPTETCETRGVLMHNKMSVGGDCLKETCTTSLSQFLKMGKGRLAYFTPKCDYPSF